LTTAKFGFRGYGRRHPTAPESLKTRDGLRELGEKQELTRFPRRSCQRTGRAQPVALTVWLPLGIVAGPWLDIAGRNSIVLKRV